MALSEAEVRHVARLARLDLSDDDVAELAPQLSQILEYAEQVGEVAADDVEPMVHPFPVTNVMRDDHPAASLPRDEVLSQAPDAREDRFAVPRIVAEDA
ncbi:Asp-tRNA(Asn)/Glu-tRNA(Gln) amidotransferase subunit GatC [Salsipaludibacter albus]|uniref:Asp-tRNA(Asn)/Glu-tRNA(Gln) amidotransferase subunit GatC n=1 Tax=Salsipaludibacter albus TaxID=2849650 RepID=UPI001EE42A7F|nr:Asp-tRNA(Asn)/Glu-tRNA(Gln) amidotransferase subunit GatC [Salsipaludibacter albus]MBY5163676.1 Asp-tRNA(Asn)/Glu-tRNA(Gln) amidotransferase subunit GatC [Salsipaludibacter albus]